MEGWQARAAHDEGDQQVPDNLTQDEARARAAVVTVSSYQVDLDLTGGDTTFSSTTVARFEAGSGGSETFINLTAPKVLEITLNGSPLPLDAFDGDRITLAGLNQDNELRVVAECALLQQRRGPAPLHRPHGRRRLPVLRPGDVRRAPDLRLLRPARPEGDLRTDRDRPRGLAGRVEHGPGLRGSGRRRGQALALPAHAGHVDLHHRDRRRPVPRGAGFHTTASRSASTAASHWLSTSTPTRSSRSPGRASTSTTRPSGSGTRSASTTSSSCPSSRRARWRTRAA